MFRIFVVVVCLVGFFCLLLEWIFLFVFLLCFDWLGFFVGLERGLACLFFFFACGFGAGGQEVFFFCICLVVFLNQIIMYRSERKACFFSKKKIKLFSLL